MNRLRLLFGILTFLILSLISCVDLPEEIILPEWDVDLNIPIINKTYTIYDVVKPESKHPLTGTLTNDDFYMIQTEKINSSSNVGNYISVTNQNSVSQNFILPANEQLQPIFIFFPEGIKITQATFSSGFISFIIQNPSTASVLSSLRIPGIRKPDGNELILQKDVPALGKDSILYELKDHYYSLPPDQPIQNQNSLQIVPSASSSINGAFVNVELNDYDFKFSSLSGVLPRTSLGNKRTSASLNLNDAADYRGKLFIKEGALNLKTEYMSAHKNNFDIEISNLNIKGIRNSDEEKSLTRNDGQSISFRLSNGMHELLLDETNSNLAEFISFLPDSIVVTSEVIMNPLNYQVNKTITNLDSITFSAQFTTKSIFAIKQIYYADTIDINFSQEERKKINDGVGADLNANLENAIPIDAFFKVTLTDENYIPLFTLTKNQSGVDSLQFLGAQVNGITGQIIAPTVTLNTINLNSSQIVQLSKAYHAIISTTVSTTNAGNENPNPPTVQFRSSDWLNLKCYGKVKYHVNPEGK